MPRVKSDIYVAGLLRAAQTRGVMGAVVSRGQSDAGSVFIICYDPRAGHSSLWAPAPQTAFMDADANEQNDRHFECRLSAASQADVDSHLERERNFDPDFWVVELEGRENELDGLFRSVAPD